MRAMLGRALETYEGTAACGVLLVVVGIFVAWTLVLYNRKSKPILEHGSRLPLEEGEKEERDGNR